MAGLARPCGPAGQKPGTILDREPAKVEYDAAKVDAAYAAADHALSNAWRMGAKPPDLPKTREGAQAYYDTRLATAYRGGVR